MPDSGPDKGGSGSVQEVRGGGNWMNYNIWLIYSLNVWDGLVENVNTRVGLGDELYTAKSGVYETVSGSIYPIVRKNRPDYGDWDRVP